MPEHHKNHVVPYKTYGFVLAGLIAFTLLSVAVTQIYLGPLSVFVALLLAGLKTTLVFMYFMHLKFERRTYIILVVFVLVLYVAVIVVTMLDYIFRIT
jgi:cytochrome c oxidase subunit 4